MDLASLVQNMVYYFGGGLAIGFGTNLMGNIAAHHAGPNPMIRLAARGAVVAIASTLASRGLDLETAQATVTFFTGFSAAQTGLRKDLSFLLPAVGQDVLETV